MSLYLKNDTSYDRSYSGRRIGTRMSNGAIFNDLERPIIPIIRSCQYSTYAVNFYISIVIAFYAIKKKNFPTTRFGGYSIELP